MPPAGGLVPAPASPPAIPGQLLQGGLWPLAFPCFFTLAPLIGAAAHWCLHNRRASAWSTPALRPHGGAVGLVSAGLGHGGTSEQVEPHFV